MIKHVNVNNWDSLPVILDLRTVSLIFNVADITVRRWISKNKIKGKKIGNKWLFEKDYIRSIVDNDKNFD